MQNSDHSRSSPPKSEKDPMEDGSDVPAPARQSSRLASQPFKLHRRWDDFEMGGRIERTNAGKSGGGRVKGVDGRLVAKKRQRGSGTEDGEEEAQDVARAMTEAQEQGNKAGSVEGRGGEMRAEESGPEQVVSKVEGERGKEHDKYCHFCQHVKINMLACENAGCTHRYCIYCLSAHLGDDTDPAASAAWTAGSWLCPTCRSMCCCSYPDCARSHRHCKAFRYRCRRAEAASMRSTAAHALVSLAASTDGPKPDPARGGKKGAQKSRAGGKGGKGGRGAGATVSGGGAGKEVEAEKEGAKGNRGKGAEAQGGAEKSGGRKKGEAAGAQAGRGGEGAGRSEKKREGAQEEEAAAESEGAPKRMRQANAGGAKGDGGKGSGGDVEGGGRKEGGERKEDEEKGEAAEKKKGEGEKGEGETGGQGGVALEALALLSAAAAGEKRGRGEGGAETGEGGEKRRRGGEGGEGEEAAGGGSEGGERAGSAGRREEGEGEGDEGRRAGQGGAEVVGAGAMGESGGVGADCEVGGAVEGAVPGGGGSP